MGNGARELELALVKLYKVTGRMKSTCAWPTGCWGERAWLCQGLYLDRLEGYRLTQDVLPGKAADTDTGHAVRAMFYSTGAADVAAQTGDTGYHQSHARREDVVYRNMYITGGIGSAGSNEAFLLTMICPMNKLHCETCASVGMVFWNQRMNAMTGDAEYIDVLERSLYNGALDGLSLSGDHFFMNPLASRGQHQRREWFGTACCQANLQDCGALGIISMPNRMMRSMWICLWGGDDRI